MLNAVTKSRWHIDNSIYGCAKILSEGLFEAPKDELLRRIQTHLVTARNEIIESMKLIKELEDMCICKD